MRKIFLIVAAALLAIGLIAYFAFQKVKQTIVDAVDCAQTQDSDREISGCSHIIEATNGKEGALTVTDRKNVANAYLNRGYAFSRTHQNKSARADWEKAIALDSELAMAYNDLGSLDSDEGNFEQAKDRLDTAIRLNPGFAMAYANRAYVLLRRGQAADALEDASTAVRFDPKSIRAYDVRVQIDLAADNYAAALADSDQMQTLAPNTADASFDSGMAHFALGNFAASAQDFSDAFRHNPYPYNMLWHALALQHLEQDSAAQVSTDLSQLSGKDWPNPVVEFYRGERSADDMVAAASNDDQRCEANFYLGEWQVLHHDADAAIPLLQKAADTCPKHFMEYTGARAELKRLKP